MFGGGRYPSQGGFDCAGLCMYLIRFVVQALI